MKGWKLEGKLPVRQMRIRAEELDSQGYETHLDGFTGVLYYRKKKGSKRSLKKMVIISKPVVNKIPLRVKLKKIFKLSVLLGFLVFWNWWVMTIYSSDPTVQAQTYNTAEWLNAIDTEIVSDSTENYVLTETKKAEPNDIQSVIIKAANEYGVDSSLMLSIAYCESRYNPNAKNKTSSASGLFQHINATWNGHRAKMGLPTDLDLRFNAYESARTAAWSISQGGLRNWDASKSCWSN